MKIKEAKLKKLLTFLTIVLFSFSAHALVKTDQVFCAELKNYVKTAHTVFKNTLNSKKIYNSDEEWNNTWKRELEIAHKSAFIFNSICK